MFIGKSFRDVGVLPFPFLLTLWIQQCLCLFCLFLGMTPHIHLLETWLWRGEKGKGQKTMCFLEILQYIATADHKNMHGKTMCWRQSRRSRTGGSCAGGKAGGLRGRSEGLRSGSSGNWQTLEKICLKASIPLVFVGRFAWGVIFQQLSM